MTMKAYSEEYIQDIANAIREKNGETSLYVLSAMPAKIRAMNNLKLQDKIVRLTDNPRSLVTVTPSNGYAINKVVLEPPIIDTTVTNMFNDETKVYINNGSGGSAGNGSYSTTNIAPNGSAISKNLYDSTGNLGEVYRSPNIKPNLNNTHIYYFSVFLYQTTKHGSFDFYWPVAEPPVVSNAVVSANKTWTKVSQRFTRTGFSNGEQWARCDFNSPGSYTLVYNGLLLVDLTASFGAGYEPDKAWCDANIIYTTNNTKQAVSYTLP